MGDCKGTVIPIDPKLNKLNPGKCDCGASVTLPFKSAAK